jgi:hypothetical protein
MFGLDLKSVAVGVAIGMLVIPRVIGAVSARSAGSKAA